MIPNAVVNDHNGVLFEAFLPNGEKICSDRYENWGEGTKTTYSPLKYPKTQLVINDKPVQLHHDIKDHSAFWSYYECVLRQDYKGIESGDVCVDVGANLGFFSLSAIKQGAAKCYSLEPFPSTFEYLTKNTEGLPIQPINVGIGSEDKEVFFVGGEVTSISRNVEHEDKEAYSFWGDNINRVPVRLKPFDQVIKENDIKFIDYLKVDCEGGEVELFDTIDPEFLKHRVKKIAGEIHLFVTGVDGYLKIKNQIINAGFEYEDDYREGEELVVFFARRKPKIKLIHILNDIDGAREKASINSLKSLEEHGIHYEQHVSPLYRDMPPTENCNRPAQVSLEPGDYLLSPGHYGCYLGHKGAVCDSGEDFDGVVISECDTILQASAKEMSEKFEQVYFENIKNDLILTSFGKRLEGFEHEHVTDDIYWSRKIVEAHLYLVSKPHLTELRRLFNEKPWDVADLWYDVFVSSYKRGITKKPYALQAVGNSYLDKTFKDGHIIHDFEVVYNPNRIDDDITVIVQTCDKYENIWNGWYASFSKFWTWETGWPVYFCNEEKDLPFNDSRINQIKSPKSENADGFSTRLIDILSKVKTKYVLYLQEDMWLMNKLDPRTLKESLYKMRYNDWNGLRIHEKIWLSYELMKTNQFVNGRRILKSKSTSEWLLSHNASIWNREFLLSQMEPEENPWKNEINGTVRICNKYTDPKIYHLNERWYYQPGASQNGRLNDFMSQYQDYLIMAESLEKQFDTKEVK
jgi:FkbM family methyltransferase